MGLYPRKGVIAAGSDADLAIIDPEKRIEVDHRTMETNADWSPYQGWSLAGFAETTFCRGRKIVEDYKFVGESGWGRWLPRERAGSLDGSEDQSGITRITRMIESIDWLVDLYPCIRVIRLIPIAGPSAARCFSDRPSPGVVHVPGR